MKLLKFIALGLTVVSSGLGLKAQSDSSYSFTLLEAQNYAIENYFASKNAELDIEAAQKKIWETTAIGLPQVSVSSDYQHIPNPPTIDFQMGPNPEDIASFPSAPEHNITYGATVSQLIFSGEYIVGLQAAKVYRSLSEENYEKIKIDLKENIAGTYFTILVLEANTSVLEKTLANLKENLSQTQKTFEAGLIDDSEVDQLQLTVKRTESDLATLNNQVEYMRRLFKYQLGLSIEDEIVLNEELDALIDQNIISETNYNFNLDENIEYNLLQTNEELQKLNLDRYKSTYLPTIAGFYSYSDQTDEAGLMPTINHVIGVSASWSIFQSGQRNAQVSQAKIELVKAQNIKSQEAERLKLTAQQATFDYQTALQKYNNEKMNFELSEKVLDKTNERFKHGVVSSLEQSIVNTQFLGAQISFASAIQELLTAKIALDKAYNKL